MNDHAEQTLVLDGPQPEPMPPKQQDVAVARDHAPSSVPAEPASEATQLMAIIARAASDPSIDLDKMDRLLAMRERIKAEQARQAFFEDMAIAQGEITPVVARAKNDQTSSKYAKLEAVNAAIMPIITKHGFSISFGTDAPQQPDCIGVTYRIRHRLGHVENDRADVPIDMLGIKGNPNKTKTHAYGSTLSYGRRYATLLAFNVAVKNEDDDGNAAGGKVRDFLSEDQVDALRKLIIEVDADLPKLLAYLKIERLEDIYADQFDRVVKVVEQKRKAAEKKASAQ